MGHNGKFQREYLGADLAWRLVNRRELSGAVLPQEQNGHPVPEEFPVASNYHSLIAFSQRSNVPQSNQRPFWTL